MNPVKQFSAMQRCRRRVQGVLLPPENIRILDEESSARHGISALNEMP
jgi:hypothetical protein